MVNVRKLLLIIGLGLSVFAFASPVSALDGYVHGYLKTFDLRNLRCDDSRYPCQGASKLQSEYNLLPASLRLKYAKVEIINAATNGNICVGDVYTSSTGYFRCNYRNVSGNPLTFLRVYWRDKNARFKLANVYFNSKGVAAVSDWFTDYPQSHGGGNIRLQGGAQRYSVNNDGQVYFYEDNVSSDDMAAANLYADTQLTFEKIAAGGANRFLDEIPTSDGRMIIGIDRNKYLFTGVYAQAQGFCCYNESFTGQSESISDLNDRVHPIVSPYIFENYPYLTEVVHHEIGHSLVTLSSLYFHGEAIVPWSHGYSENCPRTTAYPWSVTYQYNASCYQPTEALAEMFSTAVVFGQSSPPGEAKQVYTDGRIDGNPGEIVLEPRNCACARDDGNRLIDGMRYFWDLYDTHRDSGSNCQDENISLELWQVFEHAMLNTMSDGEGSPYRLDYEAADYRRESCGDVAQRLHLVTTCRHEDEGGLFDMAHFAYDTSTNWDYIDIWRNNCKSRGDYSWQYSGENQYGDDKRNYCMEKCTAQITPSIPPGSRLDGVAEAIVACADTCVIEE